MPWHSLPWEVSGTGTRGSFILSSISIYGNVQAGIPPLEINIPAMNLIFGYQWSYAISKPELLRYELSPFDIARSRERHIVQISMSLIAIRISFFSPALSTLPYILLPFLFMSKRYQLVK